MAPLSRRVRIEIELLSRFFVNRTFDHQGHKVYWTSAKKLQADIFEARAKNNLDILFKKILSAKLWIYDDFGVVSYPREIAEEVFDLLDRRKHSSAMILTSNREVKEWCQVFPDAVLANAAIDRMFEHAIVHVFKGKSYRLKGKIVEKCRSLLRSDIFSLNDPSQTTPEHG